MEPERRSAVARHAALVRWGSPEDDSERFWSNVDKQSDEDGGCWLWLGASNVRGEGQVRRNGKLYAAHRIAWEEEHGPLPKGRPLRFTCRHPNCVRPHPDHVRVGAKLNAADVVAIRASSQSQRSIAADYGVSQPMIAAIRSRRAWAHVP